MAKTLATKLVASITGTYTNRIDLQEAPSPINIAKAISMKTGVGTNQNDRFWSDTRTLAATTESLDLAGSLTDIFGATLTFAKVKLIYVFNRSVTTGENLLVGGAASNQFINWVSDATDEVVVGPGGLLLLTSPIDGYTVTASTGDILQVDSGSDTIVYDIAICGTSA